MAAKKKSTPRYDLKAQDRKRDLAVRLGLTALVVAFAVGLVLFIVMGNDKKDISDVQAVRLSSDSLVKKEGTDEPKAVLSIYEDFSCSHCRDFQETFGPTINKIVDSGAAAVDYYMMGILNTASRGYSGRAANAAYCVADESKDAFKRFHGALMAQQPMDPASGPDNRALTETARQAGAGGTVPDCISKDTYGKMVKGLAAATEVSATPTIRLNGQDISPANPDELLAKVRAVAGPVPGLMPTPSAPPPAEVAP